MPTEPTTVPARPGGFDGDPLAALNPPTAATGCCSSDPTAGESNAIPTALPATAPARMSPPPPTQPNAADDTQHDSGAGAPHRFR